MRTLIDIPEEALSQLNDLSKTRKVSRSELVRSAITEYLKAQDANLIHRAFGIWADRNEDGLAYQERMRSEW